MDGGDYVQVLHANVWWTMELDLIIHKFSYYRARELCWIFDNQCVALSVQCFTVGTHFVNLKGSGKSHMLHGGILPKSESYSQH